MKKLIALAVILAAVGVGLVVANTVDWKPIDAASPFICEEDADAEEFAARIADLIMGEVDPDDLQPEVREQLRGYIAEVLPVLVDAYWGVDDLYTIKRIWLPVIKDLRERVDALEQALSEIAPAGE